MSDPKDPNNPLEELQKQLQEALRGGNLGFGFPQKSGAEVTGEDFEDVKEPELEGMGAVPEESDSEILERIRDFNLKPREIRDHLNRFVVKQQDAKKVLSVAICDHYNHVRQCLQDEEVASSEYAKQNILLLGPTGVGKTYLMRNIAKLIGVPFVKADATKFSETGYVGADVEDLVRDLVKAANGNVELAQYGIIYIDEVDKIAGGGDGGQTKDVSGRGVQINLLKLMEESDVNLFSPTDMMSQMQAMMDFGGSSKKKKKSINTRHILFIVSGAFDKLAESIKARVARSQIGFGSTVEADDDMSRYLKQVSTTDFIKYGFEPEFIGRLPVRVSCENLNQEDLARILTSSEGSILKQYRHDFNGYGIDFDITDEAVEEIARLASLERTGARGLMTVLERSFRDFKFELPSTAIKSFEVTTDTVGDPGPELKKLLKENQHLQEHVLKDDLVRFAESFERLHGLAIEFSDEAADVLMEEAVDEDMTIRALCENKYKDFQHGLGIINRNTGQREFVINKAAAENADKELSEWVVRSFEESEKQAEAVEGKPKKKVAKKKVVKKKKEGGEE